MVASTGLELGGRTEKDRRTAVRFQTREKGGEDGGFDGEVESFLGVPAKSHFARPIGDERALY